MSEPITLAAAATLATAPAAATPDKAAAAVDLAYCAADVLLPFIVQHEGAATAIAAGAAFFASSFGVVAFKVLRHVVETTDTDVDDKILNAVAGVGDYLTSKKTVRGSKAK